MTTVESLLVTRRDLADTLCFLERHERDSERSACDVCEDSATAMMELLRARAAWVAEP